jgi:hypothetical protein
MSAPRSTPGPLLTGEFRDGPFAGLGYRTPSVEGATDDE